MNTSAVASFIQTILLPYDGTHHHFGELAYMLLRETVKSTVVDGAFVLHTRGSTVSPWTRLAHNDLLMSKVRNELSHAFDEARYRIKTPPPGYSIDKWQGELMKILKLQEKLYDHTFMKGVMGEFLLFVYSPV